MSATQSGCYNTVGKGSVNKAERCWMKKEEAIPALPTSMREPPDLSLLTQARGRERQGVTIGLRTPAAPPLKSGHASLVLWSLPSEALPGT